MASFHPDPPRLASVSSSPSIGTHSSDVSPPVARVIEAFRRLPGIGPKSAQRLAYHLVRMSSAEAEELAQAVIGIKERIILCQQCFNITEQQPCSICRDTARDSAIICVVEEPLDVASIERTRTYHGLYHVLHGAISPTNHVSPSDLKIKELLQRLRNNHAEEVILATNTGLDSEATAMYIHQAIAPSGIRVTRLARGLPTGSDIEYADDATLAHSLESRSEINNP